MSEDNPSYTGIFVRLQRDGQWVSADIVTLGDEELAAFVAAVGRTDWSSWVIRLAGWIRDHVVFTPEDAVAEATARLWQALGQLRATSTLGEQFVAPAEVGREFSAALTAYESLMEQREEG